MYAQLTYFDGPGAGTDCAADRAGRERIEPAIMARPDLRDDLVAMYVLRRPDGGQITVVIVEHEDTLDKAIELIMATRCSQAKTSRSCLGPIATSGTKS